MFTFLTRFIFISAFFASLITSAFAEDSTASSNTPQHQANTQLPEWFYRELISIKSDISRLDATDVSKEDIRKINDRIDVVVNRVGDQELSLSLHNERVGDIADSNAFALALFSVIAGVLGTLIAVFSIYSSWNAKREAVANAKDFAHKEVTKWINNTEKELTDNFKNSIQNQSDKFNKEFEGIKENAEIQFAKTMVNRAISMAANGHLNGHLKNAMNEFDDVIREYKNSRCVVIEEQVAIALFYKGAILEELKYTDKAIIEYQTLIDNFYNRKEIPIKRQVTNALASKTELVLFYKSKLEAKEAIAETVAYIGNAFSVNRAVMEMFYYIIDEVSYESVINIINGIPADEESTWEFSKIRSLIEKLEEPRKAEVKAFARFFESHKDKAKLLEELDKIPQKL